MVQVISREMIKPSSPTPLHLQQMKRSYLDQLTEHVFIPLFFFYQAADIHDHDLHTPHHLKQSLSLALTSFYPLAGRIMQDGFIVDCNDAGVEFVDASVDAHLDDAMHGPDLKHYLPTDTSGEEVGPLFRVQINSFKCGGIAIGVCFSHRIADCSSIMAFMGAWSATNCRSDQIPPSPISFDELASFFPGREFPPPGPASTPMPAGEKLRMKRFVFDKSKLAALRQMASICPSGDDHVKNPTRVELVSAFIWKNFMAKQPSNKMFAAMHGVNLRARKRPLEDVFGNCLMLSFSQSTPDQDFHQLISKLRSSIRKIDDDYITKSQGSGGDEYLGDVCKYILPAINGEMESLALSSWCRFPVYEVDFGWGKPDWVCVTDLALKFSTTILVNTRCGEGIEAWVSMNQEKLDNLEAKLELISTDIYS